MSIEPEFWPLFVAGCARIGVAPLDLLAVAANESSLNPHAWNEGGRAGGLWQLTPAGAGAAGWPRDQTHRFATLTASEQWPFWERYFGGHRGQLVSRAACYVCTGWPAGLAIAGNPDALLCSEDGRTDIPVPHEYAHLGKWPAEEVQSWYHGNISFDRGHTGEIHVRDLTAAIDRSCLALGGVWSDVCVTVQRELARTRDTQPEVIVAADNQPVFASPEPPEWDPEAA
jgi:hypothetical protein